MAGELIFKLLILLIQAAYDKEKQISFYACFRCQPRGIQCNKSVTSFCLTSSLFITDRFEFVSQFLQAHPDGRTEL